MGASKKLKTYLILFLAVGALLFSCHSISCEAYTIHGNSKVVKKSGASTLKIVLLKMFSTPDKKFAKAFKESMTVVTQSGSTIKSDADSSKQYCETGSIMLMVNTLLMIVLNRSKGLGCTISKGVLSIMI